jgi:VWFA-related protein
VTRFLTSAAIVALCVLTPVLRPAAQQQFRGRTDIVSVYATVMDANGRLVPGLTAADFEVRDNGKKQQIEFFSNDQQPITVVLMLDRSGSMADNFVLVQDAADQFVRKLTDDDRARIGSFSRDIVISPADFTNSQAQLSGILKHGLQSVGPSPVWTAIDRSITALLDQSGRRVVLVFTDGHDDPGPGQVSTDLKDVIRRATYDEVMVYTIGLANSDDMLSAYSLHNVIGQASLGRGTRQKTVKPDPGLRRLAELTGGGYFQLDWGQDLGATFARVADELHRQYWLAFRPGKLDGEVHRLDIRVTRRDLIARARRSYAAAER